jgi:phage tail protein X
MMEACVQYYRSKEGDTVDRIVWLYYGRQNDGIVEAVLAANHDLASYGPILPEGLQIALPEISDDDQSTGSVRLWD